MPPKCGTTTLHTILAAHTEVSGASNKESRYFSSISRSELTGPGSREFISTMVVEEAEYLELFPAKHGARYFLDSSTDYFTDPAAIQRIEIEQAHEAPRYIVVLRDPVKRAISEYKHTVRDGIETESLYDSINLELDGFRDRWVPLFHHCYRSRYELHVAKLLQLIPRCRMLILDYEELNSEPALVFQKIENFLNLRTPLRLSDGIRKNMSGRPMFRFLHSLKNPDSLLHRYIKRTLSPETIGRISLLVDTYNLRPIELDSRGTLLLNSTLSLSQEFYLKVISSEFQR